MSNQLVAHFRVVTPMFLGGAIPTADAELRPASIKGALRFWWRALAWSHETTSVADLRKKEAALFGSSETGQAKFLLTTSPLAKPTNIPTNSVLGKTGTGATVPNAPANAIVGDGARYLGYGLMAAFASRVTNTQAGQLSRPCLASPFEFEVRLAFKNSVTDKERTSITDALKLLGLCGGLGSRSRRGWGSLTLTHIKGATKNENWTAPKTITDYESTFRKIAASQNTALPEWTAFAAGHSKLLLLQDDTPTSPLEVLSKIGRDFVFFRSWGHDGQVLGEPREGNFEFDHDLSKDHPHDRDAHPQRIVFGLPQNYGRSEQDQVVPASADLDRRASPLLFHIHQAAPTDIPIGVLTFLPARFLPEGKRNVKFGGPLVPLGDNGGVPFWQPALDFLSRLRDGTGHEIFQTPKEVNL
jgi:CRISPR-associated protein Cmr1